MILSLSLSPFWQPFSSWTWVSRCKGWWRYQLDYSSYKSCKAPVKSSSPTNQHPVFFKGRLPLLSPNQQCQSTEGKISHSTDLLTPSSPGVFQLCLWPLIAPGYLGGGLPCLSSALWCLTAYNRSVCTVPPDAGFYNSVVQQNSCWSLPKCVMAYDYCYAKDFMIRCSFTGMV